MEDAVKVSKPWMLWLLLSRREKQWFTGLTVLMFFGMMLEMVGISLTIPTIALLLDPNRISEYEILENLIIYVFGASFIDSDFMMLSGLIALASFYLMKTVYLTFLIWCQAKFAHVVHRDLSRSLFVKYIQQDYSFYLKRNSAELIQNVIGEVNLFTLALQSKLTLITESLVLIGVISLLIIQPIGTLTMAVLVLGSSLIFYIFTKNLVRNLGNGRQFHEENKIKHLQQGVGGIKDVKISGSEGYFIDIFHNHNTKAAAIGAKIASIQNIPRVWLEFLAVFSAVSLVFAYAFMGKDMQGSCRT